MFIFIKRKTLIFLFPLIGCLVLGFVIQDKLIQWAAFLIAILYMFLLGMGIEHFNRHYCFGRDDTVWNPSEKKRRSFLHLFLFWNLCIEAAGRYAVFKSEVQDSVPLVVSCKLWEFIWCDEWVKNILFLAKRN